MDQNTQQHKPDMFRAFMPLGIFLGMGSLFFDIFVLGKHGAGLMEDGGYSLVYVWLGVIALSITIPLLWNAFKKRTLGQHLGGIFSCLFSGAMFGALPVMMVAMLIFSHVDNVKYVEKFAASDFAQFDADHDGVVTYADLDSVVMGQITIKSSIKALEDAKTALAATKMQTASAAQTVKDLDSAEADLKAQILPEDQMTRIFTVKQDLFEFGHVVTTPAPARAYVQDYGATPQEMAGYQTKLETRYHYWFVAFKTLHLM